MKYQQVLKLQYFYSTYSNQQRNKKQPVVLYLFNYSQLECKAGKNQNGNNAGQSACFNAQEN